LNVQIGGIQDLHVGPLTLYPNPANQQLMVEVANWKQLPEGTLVNIYDVLGNVLVSEKLVDEKDNTQHRTFTKRNLFRTCER
jgi:hypothetical protein